MLQGVVRDFSRDHPDFEYALGVDYGIVHSMLAADGKPIYAGNPTTPTTNGREHFDQWYRDVPGVNIPIPIEIPLEPIDGGLYTYDSTAFFPIDGQGFGNESLDHNFHFTLEIRTEFEYKGGEVFRFRGDDDLFTFINGRLAIDLGGVHGAMESTVDLDARAAELGITPGNRYTLDFFFAERHTTQSNFRIETSISCFTPVTPPQ
ncbi:lipoprotein [Chondromyces crocatus]|uniref:Lipoprotein n=1 Tax=Chondromyces crocatus TaxID=52 RepID=A0A0K1ET07_CHOCO|nr:lipoprotein [Chondromyces crocatus]